MAAGRQRRQAEELAQDFLRVGQPAASSISQEQARDCD
jgi:hypothetical protein